MDVLGGVVAGSFGTYILIAFLLAIAVILLYCVVFFYIVKNAVKWGTFEAMIKYLDYIDECKARTKQDKYNRDLDD